MHQSDERDKPGYTTARLFCAYKLIAKKLAVPFQEKLLSSTGANL